MKLSLIKSWHRKTHLITFLNTVPSEDMLQLPRLSAEGHSESAAPLPGSLGREVSPAVF